MESLKKASVYYHDPFLQSEEEVKEFLRSKGPGSAHALQRKLYIFTGERQEFVVVNLDQFSESTFLNSVSLADASEQTIQRLDKYSQLAGVRNFTVQLVAQGETLEVPFQNGINSIVVTDKRGSDYFDYVVYVKVANKFGCLAYSNTNLLAGAFLHSGDIGSLLHYVSYGNTLPENVPFIMGVTGFHRRYLRLFVDQLPAVLLSNSDNETLYLVPCPLDEATLQNATFAGIAVGKRVGDKIKYAILSTPVIMNGIDTGHTSAEMNRLMDDAVCRAEALWAAPPPQPTRAAPQVDEERAVQEVVKKAKLDDSLPTGTVLSIVEDGLELSPSGAPLFVQFGTGLHVASTFTKRKAGAVSLPFSGLCSGPAALALGTPYEGSISGSWENFYSLLEQNMPVVHVSTKWIDQVKMSCDTLLNGIFIVHSDAEGATEAALNNTNVSAVSAMAGPNALVLVKLGEEYFFYRGVRWPNLQALPAFGSNVTPFVQSLSWVQVPWPLFTSRKDNSIFWKGNMVSIDRLAADLQTMNFDRIAEATADLEDVITQLKVLLSAEELRTFTDRFTKVLSDLMGKQLASAKAEVERALRATVMDEKELQKVLGNFRHISRTANRAISGITMALASAISLKGASSRAHDLRSLERRRAISSNVEAAKNMTMEQKFELLENECTECGVIISTIDAGKFQQLLSSLAAGNLLDTIKADPSPAMALDPRTPLLDSITLGSLLECTQGKEHFLVGSPQCVALPTATGSSSLPFPLFDRHIRLADPAIGWIDEANLPNVAMFRILLRGTISEATTSRTFNISPADRNLGYFLLHGIISTMESIAKGFSTVPNAEADWDNTSCQMMRGLFGQAFSLLASGNVPLSLAFQLTTKSPNLDVPDDNQWWIYRRLVQCFPYTCWPTTNIYNNVKLLLIRAIRKRVVDPATNPLRDQTAAIDAKKQADFVDKRNKELKFARLATEVLFRMREKCTPEIATRLLESLPSEPVKKKSGTARLIHFFRRVENGKADWGEGFSKICQIALDIHTRRSACFKPIKSKLLEAVTANGAADEAVIELQKKKDQLKEVSNAYRVRVQNQEAIDKLEADRIKGDAELRRKPWTLDTPLDEVEHLKKLTYILTGNAFEPSAADLGDLGSEQKAADDNKPQDTAIVATFRNLEGGLKALKLATQLPTLELANLSLPASEISQLMEVVGWSTSTLRQIVEVLLQNWADVIESEKKALAIFSAL